MACVQWPWPPGQALSPDAQQEGLARNGVWGNRRLTLKTSLLVFAADLELVYSVDRSRMDYGDDAPLRGQVQVQKVDLGS